MKRTLAAGLAGIILAITFTLIPGSLDAVRAQTGAPGSPTVITPQPPSQNPDDRSYLPPQQPRSLDGL